MSAKSKIEWTESSWNPVTGCTKISPGCANCYAERLALRLRAMGQKNYKNGFELAIHERMFLKPLEIKKPTTFFVNSMSDLFHEHIPVKVIQKIFSVMNQASWHIFQVLTKREARLVELSPHLTWTKNIWMGVTVESNEYIYRADALRQCGAHVKFLSLEPLLSSLPDLSYQDIDWVIVGGESGPNCRAIKEEWVKEIRDKCIDASIPFFFKQWGGVQKKKNGALLEGKEWKEYPKKQSKPSDIFSF